MLPDDAAAGEVAGAAALLEEPDVEVEVEVEPDPEPDPEDDAPLSEAGAEAALDPDPVIPPVAPVAAIRALASACVVQVILVPALLTRGSAKH